MSGTLPAPLLHAEALSLGLRVELQTAAIHEAREAIEGLTLRWLEDGADLGSRLGMVTYELLENSFVHGVDRASTLTFSATGGIANRVIRVSVKSRIDPGRADALRTSVAEVEAAGDPWAHYAAAMRRTAFQTTGSGLGLARIRAEGEMQIHVEIEGAFARVEATLAPKEIGSDFRQDGGRMTTKTALATCAMKTTALSATTTHEGSVVRVELTGNADSDARDGLAKLLAELNGEAKRLGATAVVVSLNDLYFMTSSCLSVVVRWLAGVDGNYKIRFQCNPSLRWQHKNVALLREFAPDRVSVDP